MTGISILQMKKASLIKIQQLIQGNISSQSGGAGLQLQVCWFQSLCSLLFLPQNKNQNKTKTHLFM